VVCRAGDNGERSSKKNGRGMYPLARKKKPAQRRQISVEQSLVAWSAAKSAGYPILIENFAFADNYCVYVSLENRRRWDVPKVAGKHLFTACK
jgi:hypothetical protein